MTDQPTVYRASWVLPVTAPPIRDGAVRVDPKGRIEAVGAARDIEAADAPLVDLGDSAITPGFVNVHAHPELTLLRGRLEDVAFPDWIQQLVEFKYQRLTPEDLSASTQLGVAEAIASGVTCLGAPDDAGFLQRAMMDAGLRGRVYRELFGPDPDHAESALKDVTAKIVEMRSVENELVGVGVSPHAPYTVSRKLFSAVADFAAAEALPVCIHAAESSEEEAFVRSGGGPFADRLRARGIELEATDRSPIAWLGETGILATQPLLVHCVRVEGDDVARIADAGAAVAHCPVSNAKLGHGAAPLLDFMEAGIPVGLGSDSVASNNRVDMLGEARFSALVQRVALGKSGVLSAEDLLRLSTLGGATALGLDDRIGSIEPGKDADLVSVRLNAPHVLPVSDPVAALIHSATAADVHLTMVRGRILYRHDEWTTLNLTEILDRANAVPTGDGAQ